jgi:hypothetical protein
MTDFNLNDFDESMLDLGDIDGQEASQEFKKVKNSFARVKRYTRPRTAKYKFAQELVKDIGDIAEGDHINAIVSGNFVSGDLIESYLFDNNLMAEEIIISTLSMSRENVDSLRNVQEHRLNGVMGLIVSDFFFSHERKSGIEDIVNNLGDDKFALAVAGIHTKITLIKTTCGKHIVIGGSANLRSSLNIEQITIDNCPIIYAFHREWMAGILNTYQATHEMLRREKLWLQVAKEGEQRKERRESLGLQN